MININAKYLVFSKEEEDTVLKYIPSIRLEVYQEKKLYSDIIAIIRDVRSVLASNIKIKNITVGDSLNIITPWTNYIEKVEECNLQILRFEDLILNQNIPNYFNDSWFDNINFSQNRIIWELSGTYLSKFNYLRYCSYPLNFNDKTDINSVLNKYPINDLKFIVPPALRKGSLQKNEANSVKSGRVILEHVKQRMGLNDFANTDILDYGCGVKFTQSILQYDIGVKSYTGIDLDSDMINYLSQKVKVSNMNYFAVNFQNDMYNPEVQIKMNSETQLPTGKKFDLMICQSVFTHLDKDDFKNLLIILRKNTKPNTKLFFTCFIDNIMKDNWKDANPKSPLIRIYYKEEYVKNMIKESGWDIISYNRRSPKFLVSDNFLCQPS